MIQQAIEYIEESGKDIETLAADLHLPAAARYVVVSEDGSYRTMSRGQFGYNSKYLLYDYFSKLISINKPIDAKKQIHSNNYFTFFTKKPIISKEIISAYYEKLKTPEKYMWHKSWICEHLESMFSDMNPGEQVKIFFKADIKDYMEQGRNYFLDKVLSNIIVQDGVEYGTPVTITMNSKKPYERSKNRGSVEQTVLMTAEDAYKVKCFIDILRSCVARKRETLIVAEDGELIPHTYKEKYKNYVDPIDRWRFHNREEGISTIRGAHFAFKLNARGQLVILAMHPINYSPFL